MNKRRRDALWATALAGTLGLVFGLVWGHNPENINFWSRVERDGAALNAALDFIARGDFETEIEDPRFDVWRDADGVRVYVPGKLGNIEFLLSSEGHFLGGQWVLPP